MAFRAKYSRPGELSDQDLSFAAAAAKAAKGQALGFLQSCITAPLRRQPVSLRTRMRSGRECEYAGALFMALLLSARCTEAEIFRSLPRGPQAQACQTPDRMRQALPPPPALRRLFRRAAPKPGVRPWARVQSQAAGQAGPLLRIPPAEPRIAGRIFSFPHHAGNGANFLEIPFQVMRQVRPCPGKAERLA